jgi:hypothetical protein
MFREKWVLEPRTEAPSAFEGRRSLIFGPIDNLEHHSPPEHFGIEIGGVKPPFVSFSNAKPSLLAKTAERIVRPQGTTPRTSWSGCR